MLKYRNFFCELQILKENSSIDISFFTDQNVILLGKTCIVGTSMNIKKTKFKNYFKNYACY